MLLLLSSLAALLGGSLCGLVGYYVYKLQMVTLSFCVAHAALAGAALALVAGLDPMPIAMASATLAALLLGALGSGEHARELASMAVFSASSAVALLAIYVANTRVLATASLAAVLWGSVLAVTPAKLVALSLTTALFLFYVSAYRVHVDAMLYDAKLAEAEGLRVRMHELAMLLFAGAAIASTLKLTGGFLIFSLLYNPVAASIQLTRSAHAQRSFAPALGASSALAGLAASYALDLPVGASIAIASSAVLLAFCLVGWLYNKRAAERASRAQRASAS